MGLIAVDGPTGVGKSTTARRLAAELDSLLLLDPVSVSPLLADYYTGDATPSAKLDSELAFLRGRARILAAAPIDELAVADFTVMRTGPFAEFLTDPDDRSAVLAELREHVGRGPTVDVLVLLTAAPGALHERVRARDRDTEGDLTVEHLVELSRHFETWRPELLRHAASTIEIDTTHWDPRRADDLDELLDRLRVLLHADGTGTDIDRRPT